MTNIFNLGDQFWIEIFNSTRVSVAANASVNLTHAMSKRGQFLGLAAVIDFNPANAAENAAAQIAVRNQATGGFLTTGTDLGIITVEKGNNSGSAVSFGYHLIVFMKRRDR